MSRVYSVRLDSHQATIFEKYLEDTGRQANAVLSEMLRNFLQTNGDRVQPPTCAYCHRVLEFGDYALHKGDQVYDSLACFTMGLQDQLVRLIASNTGAIISDDQARFTLDFKQLLGIADYRNLGRPHYMWDTARTHYNIVLIPADQRRKPQRCVLCGRGFGAMLDGGFMLVGHDQGGRGYAHLDCLLPNPHQTGRLREAVAFAVRQFQTDLQDAEVDAPHIQLDIEEFELGVVA